MTKDTEPMLNFKNELVIDSQINEYDKNHLLFEGSCISTNGGVIESYPKLLVMRDMFLDERKQPLFLTSFEAKKHCEEQGYFLPSSQLTLAILAACFKRRSNYQYVNLLRQYWDTDFGTHIVDTEISYKENEGEIVSYDKIRLPFERTKSESPTMKLQSMSLEESLKDELMLHFLRQYSGLPDPSILQELAGYFGKQGEVWIFSGNDETRQAVVGCIDFNFILYADLSSKGSYTARGVREL